MAIDIKDPIIKAIISDMSKMMFKIEGLEKQVAAFGMKEVAADPAAGAEEVPEEEIPGPTDLDQFKPEGFDGDAPGVPAAKEPPKLADDVDPFADGIKLTDEQLDELEEDDDGDEDDDAVDDDEAEYET